MIGAGLTGVAVVGAGPAGLAAAVLLAAGGTPCTLIGPRAPADTRTTALLDGSVRALEAAHAWDEARPHAAPLRTLAILDGTRRLIRSRPVRFEAAEIGLEAFGWNIPNGRLTAALEAVVARTPAIRRVEQPVTSVRPGQEAVVLDLADGTSERVALVVAADGRGSPCRQAAGIGAMTWPYPQVALTLSVSHVLPHRDVSTEFHTETGPFTLVPLPGRRSSLVAVVRPGEGERLARLDDEALGRWIEERSDGLLGEVRIDTPRGLLPLSGLRARRLAAQRIVLTGESAHAMPPIGAQGFNLTIRDAAALAGLVAGLTDPGQEAVLAAYDRARRGDVSTRTVMVDTLNRSLLGGSLPVQAARSLGLALLDRVGPLRRFAMREGMAPALSGQGRGRLPA